MERKIKYWIRILFILFILSIVSRIWTVIDYRRISEDWTYSPERRFKIKDQVIVNTSPETGVWMQSRYHTGTNKAELGWEDLLFVIIIGTPIGMIFYYSRAWEKGPRP